MRPKSLPIGLQLARTARDVGRAFDEALGLAGGSVPVWLVLLNVKIGASANQRQLAAAVGVTEATLTHHLNAMEVDGLLTRHRDATNRRIQIVELTDVGEGAFVRLRDAAIEFDARLRRGLAAADLQQVQQTLARLTENAGAGELGSTPWSGLVGDER